MVDSGNLNVKSYWLVTLLLGAGSTWGRRDPVGRPAFMQVASGPPGDDG